MLKFRTKTSDSNSSTHNSPNENSNQTGCYFLTTIPPKYLKNSLETPSSLLVKPKDEENLNLHEISIFICLSELILRIDYHVLNYMTHLSESVEINAPTANASNTSSVNSAQNISMANYLEIIPIHYPDAILGDNFTQKIFSTKNFLFVYDQASQCIQTLRLNAKTNILRNAGKAFYNIDNLISMQCLNGNRLLVLRKDLSVDHGFVYQFFTQGLNSARGCIKFQQKVTNLTELPSVVPYFQNEYDLYFMDLTRKNLYLQHIIIGLFWLGR